MTTASKPATVLVVEDDRDVREAVADGLSEAGYDVVVAENGKVALALLREGGLHPALILLDLMMPVMDGWQFRTEQRADAGLSTIPVVALTAHEHVTDFDAAEHLRKPVPLETLLAAVARHSTPAARA